jgi:hypothetical protein
VKSWKGFRSVFLLSVLMADVVLCGASMAADLNYDVMIESADFIVVGDVTRIHNDTYTYVTIAISEFVTNPQNMSQITITIGGEVYDGVGCTGDTPHDLFYVGERVLVFVKKVGPYYRVLSGEAGKYRVWENSNIRLERCKIIDGWYAVPDFRYRTVIYSNVTAISSNGDTPVNPQDSLSPAQLPDLPPTLIWPNIIIAVITVLIVSLLVLVTWRKMKP